MKRALPSVLLVVGAAASLALAGCQGRARRAPENAAAAPPPPQEPVDRPYCESDDASRQRVAALVERLSSTDPQTFDEVARTLASMGERAVPALRDALGSPNATVRAHAALILGVLMDHRTIPDLARVAESDADDNVRCEAGRSLLAMSDPRGFDPLLDGLSSPDARRRTRCVDTLFETTGRRMGFDPCGPPEERALAVSRWRAWRDRQRVGFAPAPEPVPEPVVDGPAAPALGGPRELDAPKDPNAPNSPTPRR